MVNMMTQRAKFRMLGFITSPLQAVCLGKRTLPNGRAADGNVGLLRRVAKARMIAYQPQLDA
jgi:hypothetical protein